MAAGVIGQNIADISPGLLKILLQDKATGRYIVWATDNYEKLGEEYSASGEITPELITRQNGDIIQPRVLKAAAEQSDRTKKHAEVFTPAWICNKMNNHCDEEWFGRKDVFNTEDGCSWTPTEAPVAFPKRRTWKHYVDSRRLEITCGEAPYLVSRYDTATGEIIPIPRRIGILDRKLRVVNENAADEAEWVKWAVRAIQSVYGYEYQGDNLVIARVNILMTFAEYLQDRWNREPTAKELSKVANIIAWNLWQMDGLKGTTPIGSLEDSQYCQMTLFDDGAGDEEQAAYCKVFDWRSNESVTYNSLKKERGRA